MELILNLAGVLVAMAMGCLWLHLAPREGADRRRQLVALALLVLILFPVISVTDDLMAVQNPAETDSSLRRDHLLPRVDSTFLATAGAPEALFAEQTSGCLRLAAPGASLTHILISPAMSPIENRPPPAA